MYACTIVHINVHMYVHTYIYTYMHTIPKIPVNTKKNYLPGVNMFISLFLVTKIKITTIYQLDLCTVVTPSQNYRNNGRI